MNLLTLTNNSKDIEGFQEHFDEVIEKSLADVSIAIGSPATVEIDGNDVSDYDTIYVDADPKTSIYTRVLLEALQDNHAHCNLDHTSFFIMAKKSYLFKVLEEKGVKIPATVTVSTDKGLSEIDKDLDFPVVARKYAGFDKIDTEKVEDLESLKSFAEHSEHGRHLILVQEFVEGDVFDALYLDGEIISLKLEGDSWRLTTKKSSLNYHSLSTGQKERVEQTAQSIGTQICRVRLVGEHIVQVEPTPHLSIFRENSGKNVYGKVAKILKGDQD